MSTRLSIFWICASGLFVALVSASCQREEKTAGSTFYDRKIGPILIESCATSPSNSSCHVAADDRGNALGNLNVESYDTVSLRRDLFINYGPYGLPALLLKVAPPRELLLTAYDNEQIKITTDIAHAGGSILDQTSPSFSQIQQWIANGAQKNNAKPANKKYDKTPCAEALGTDPAFDPSVDPPNPDYGDFVANVNPVIGEKCAFGNCHGNPSNNLYLTCGIGAEQTRWNYFAAGDYVSPEPAQSEIVRRPLSTTQGGTFHEGGVIFDSPDDGSYQALLNWATAKGGPNTVPGDPGFEFFVRRVQPMLVKRGCMMLNCHSGSMFHDYRLRGGSGGHFGVQATKRNYDLSLLQVALESPDPNASRIVRKNLPPPPGGNGILHRGGALFANGGDPTACDLTAAETGPIDQQTPYCVLVAWIEKERQILMGGAEPLTGIVYVKKTFAGPTGDTPQDWEAYQPGSDLMRGTASVDATGNVTASAGSSVLGSCGLSAASADVRRPAVSWDGKKIAFSARSSQGEGFKVYVIDGANCAAEPTINAPPVDEDGGGAIANPNNDLIHNFDPTFAPDGRMVFVSTRGNTKNTAAFSWQGPTRTPADPSKLNTNLYVLENGKIRQLTFLLNQELAPSFMADGRVIMTAEKRAPEFYQLAGRRINLDGGDYHPLFGQRSTIAFNQFTDVVELADKDLAAVFSNRPAGGAAAAHGGGQLAIINRSIGVDQLSQVPEDYLQDPNAIGFPNPKFFQHSIKLIEGTSPSGAYRSPSPLPNGKLLVSYAPGVDVTSFMGKYEIVAVDPVTEQRTPLIADGSASLIWPVGIYARGNHGIFNSRLDEANGATQIIDDDSHRDRSRILYVNAPVLGSLLFQNTRTGRIISDFGSMEIWANLPPETGVKDYGGGGSFVTDDAFGQLYIRRGKLGTLNLESDGSGRVDIPGGMPISLAANVKLAIDGSSTKHFQREEVQFYPGEVVRQSFRQELFNGLCAGCHGSVNGFESHIAVNPDILTQASNVAARDKTPVDFTAAPGAGQGPPFQ